jgi:hypothetical protein
MDERRNAARFLGIPALITHPWDLAGRRTGAEPAARLRTTWLFVAVGLGLVMAVALAINFTRVEPTAVAASTILPSHLGSGYPEHYGLAGPSKVGPGPGSWLGYPPHFGLAGPSGVGPITVPIGIGAGYPPHYGLAGPSHVDDGR